MKKREKKELNINEVAELYKNYTLAQKENEAAAKPYKEALLDYATEHPDEFIENTLTFANGVRVELRTGEKPKWNDDAVDLDWVGDAIDAGMGEAVTLSIDAKKVPAKPTAVQKKLLKEIAFKLEKKETLAVCLSK